MPLMNLLQKIDLNDPEDKPKHKKLPTSDSDEETNEVGPHWIIYDFKRWIIYKYNPPLLRSMNHGLPIAF